jgi:hypothetical protein
MNKINFQQALDNPGLVFKQPQDVLSTKKLDRQQKIDILRRWEYDAREMQVADEENMRRDGSDDGTDLFDRIAVSLHALGVAPGEHESPPTKQGGE